MRVGVVLPQEWGRTDPVQAFETMALVAREAESSGFHSVWLFDHFHSAQSSERLIFECWTSTAALARETRSIRIGQMVSCNGFRNPALLAKMASTVDVLSHGRLNMGIGAGWFEQEYHAYGYEFPSTPERLRQLREAVQVILVMWTQEKATFEGKYYHVREAINQPKGVQLPHIPLFIGGKGEQVTLKLVAQYADACNFTHLGIEELERKFALLHTYCEMFGRDYHAIHRTISLNGFVGETEHEAQTLAQKRPPHQRDLVGTPATIKKRLLELEQAGVQEVIVILQDIEQVKPLQLLAQAL